MGRPFFVVRTIAQIMVVYSDIRPSVEWSASAVLAQRKQPASNFETTMRKNSNANLYLYSFLALLMGLASQVDIGSMSDKAVDRHVQASEAYIEASFKERGL